MANLIQCGFRGNYRSVKHDLVSEFYILAFENSIQYDRAVGYFNGEVFKKIFINTENFLLNNGKIRLVIGAPVSPIEYDAILDGLEKRESGYADHFTQLFLDVWRDNPNLAELLTYLIVNNQLEIKFALTNSDSDMFHVKIGIFTDSENNKIAFTGSANETVNGILNNIETIDVYNSDRDPERIQDKEEEFEEYWNGLVDPSSSLKIIPISQETIDVLKGKSPQSMPKAFFEEDKKNHYEEYLQEQIRIDDINEPHIPNTFNGKKFVLQEHQKMALNSWYSNDYTGIFKLATGSGKTVTSICGAVEMYQQGKIKYLVVVVPLINLANQWSRELRKFGFYPVECHSGNSKWRDGLGALFTDLDWGEEKICTFVTVRNTFLGDEFQNLVMNSIRNKDGKFEKLLFIGDECHGHTVADMLDKITEYTYKLGLSATPEHYRKSQTTDQLFMAYSHPLSDRKLEPIATYTIEDALKEGVLVPYNYYPVVVDLSEDESEKYQKINSQLAVLLNSAIRNDDKIQSCIRAMRKMIGNTSRKLVELENMIKAEQIAKGGCLFYSGTGMTLEGEKPQISAINSILDNFKWRASQIISKTSASERDELIKVFSMGHIDALLAMKCLDEGVDIPFCRTAFITASSNDPREFIQRRGRILRKHKNKNIAHIYDFLVRNPYEVKSISEENPTLLRKELSRAYEFGRLANNQEEVAENLKKYLDSEELEWGSKCIYQFSDLETDYESTTDDD